jgi:hypothetical protein
MTDPIKAARAAEDAAQLAAIGKISKAKRSGARIKVRDVQRPDDMPTMDAAAFYGPVGEAVKVISDYTEADPAAVLATVMAYLGSLIGPDTWFEISGVKVNAGLYVLIVGPTAMGRKGTSHSMAKKVLGPMPSVRPLVGLGSGEALVTELANTELSNKHIMIIEEEFARLLGSAGRSGSTLSAMIRQLFDGEDLGHTTVTGSEVASGYHASMVAHITREELGGTLSVSDRSNGMANRFMLIASYATKIITWDDQGDPEHPCVKTIATTRIAEIASRAAGRGRIPMTDEAFEALSTIHDQAMVGSTSTLLARLLEHVWRLTLIYALMDEAPEIDVQHVRAALAFVHYVRSTTTWVFGVDDIDPQAARLLALIVESGPEGLSKTALSAKLSNHLNAKERDLRIDDLVRKGLITVSTPKTAGRPETIYSAVTFE